MTFQVIDPTSATWALRRAAHHKARIDELDARARTALAPILAAAEAWVESEREAIETTLGPERADRLKSYTWLVNEVGAWHRTVLGDELGVAPEDLASVPKARWDALTRKAGSVPGGKIAARRTDGTPDVVDEKALVEFLRLAAPDLVRGIDKAGLNERVTVKDEGDLQGVYLDGELVPGLAAPAVKVTVTVTPGPFNPPAGVEIPWPADIDYTGDET